MILLHADAGTFLTLSLKIRLQEKVQFVSKAIPIYLLVLQYELRG